MNYFIDIHSPVTEPVLRAFTPDPQTGNILKSRLAARADAPRTGCLKGNIFLSVRVCII